MSPKRKALWQVNLHIVIPIGVAVFAVWLGMMVTWKERMQAVQKQTVEAEQKADDYKYAHVRKGFSLNWIGHWRTERPCHEEEEYQVTPETGRKTWVRRSCYTLHTQPMYKAFDTYGDMDAFYQALNTSMDQGRDWAASIARGCPEACEKFWERGNRPMWSVPMRYER